MSIDVTTCPVFDNWDITSIEDSVKKILEWGNVNVIYSTFEVGKKKERISYWNMAWEKGTIGMWHLQSPDEEKYARIHAALFIFLWCNKVSASLADQLCEDYTYQLKQREEFDMRRKLQSRPDNYVI